MIPGLKHSSS
jgi:hypothetical protein